MEANARMPRTEPANEAVEMAELAPEDDKPEILESAVDISASGLLPIAATSRHQPATLESESETLDNMLSQTTIHLEDNAEISEMSSDLNDSLNTSTTTLDMSSLSETEMDEIDESAVAAAARSATASATGSAVATAAGSAIAAEQENDEQRVKLMTGRLVDMEAKLQESRTNFETVKESNSAINMELTVAQEQLCESLKLLDEKCRLLEEIEVQKIKLFAAENKMEQKQNTPAAETSENNEIYIDDKIAKLNDEKEQISSENERLRTDLNSHLQIIEDLEHQVKSMTDSQLMAASSTSTLVGSTIQIASAGNGNGSSGNTNSVNSQLEKAESKISELLKVKEKFAEVSAENSTLAINLSEMQQEMNLMTRNATACALIPLAVVLLAMFAYYFPFFGFFGGNGSGSSGTGSGGSSTQ